MSEASASSDLPAHVRRAWKVQLESTRDHLIPWLERHDALPRVGRVLEAGAGYAGALAALAEARPDVSCHAVELVTARARLGARLADEHAVRPPLFHQGDLTDVTSLGALEPPYDLIVLRDVIEHIEDRRAALENVRRLLGDSGTVAFTFPSYLSPFGGHQQNLKSPALRVPWLQLTPAFLPLVRWLDPRAHAEMASLRRCGLTTRRLERDLHHCGLGVVAKRHFLLRPIFRYRYGLPVVEAGPIGRVPGARDLLTTASWYLARRAGTG